jgi:hypothetical protein
MTQQEILSWLLHGDVAIQYQTWRDLLHKNKPALRKRIESEGWGAEFLSRRSSGGHWGRGFYQPKWTSTHYTLLDLKNLGISPANKTIRETLRLVFAKEKAPDGGVLAIGAEKKSDVCVNGMLLNYASYFQVKQDLLISIVDFLLKEKMADGGFNCHSNRRGAVHSSLHTTLSVLEGIHEYEKNGYDYRLPELLKARRTSEEFILMHHLFRSDKTGAVINDSFLKLNYPCRWYYDILKALDYFQSAKVSYDPRMADALEVIIEKRTPAGQWKLPSRHPGQVHFELEPAGKPSRWNTLRALRVMQWFGDVSVESTTIPNRKS